MLAIKEKIHNLGYKKIGIIGLGLTGNSVFNFFSRLGVQTICYDKDNEKCDEFLKNHKDAVIENIGKNWNDCSHIVISPGIPLYYPKESEFITFAKENNIEIISDFEIFYSILKNKAKFIAVTGTNGKSTTTSMIAHILSSSAINCSCGGNIGKPVLDLPLNSDVYVLELSSFQLELLNNFKPNISVLLNITPDHLDRHGNMDNYIESKKLLLKNQSSEDYAIINIDNPLTSWIYEEQKQNSNIKLIGVSSALNENRKDVVYCNENMIDDNYWREYVNFSNKAEFSSSHIAQNFASAYSACKAIGISMDNILKAYESFKGLDHRMQYIGCINNIKFYNDSKATNVDSVRTALQSLDNILWIAGGVDKQNGIELLLDSISTVKKCYLYGKSAHKFSKILAEYIEVEIFEDLAKAVEKAYSDCLKNGYINANILLSPACASYDQYKNFEHRGNHFVKIYNKLAKIT